MTVERPPFDTVQRFEVLDALRGICALLVALFHFRSAGFIANLSIVQNGWLFVDYFFVLSGFVIAHSYGDRLVAREISIARFMGLRMGRIYPLHVAVLLAFVAVEFTLLVFQDTLGKLTVREPFSGGRGVAALIQNIFLLQSFGLWNGLTWNGPAWSIAAEMWTYLLFAVVLFAGRSCHLAITALLVLLSFAWIAAAPGTLNLTYDGGFIRCVLGFGIGLITYHLFRHFGGVGGTAWEFAAMIAAGLYVSLIGVGLLTLAAPVVFAACIFLLASQKGAVSRFLSQPLFQLLGLTSYSIYMVHIFLQARFGEFLQVTRLVDVEPGEDGGIAIVASPLIGDAATLAMLAMLVLTAWISYRLVEKPGRDLSRRLLGRRGGVRAQAGQSH